MELLKKLKVLIADDEYAICDALTDILKKNPVTEVVSVCHDGDEALENIKAFNPDLVFLDIRMPGMTGLELANTLKEWEEPPIIVFVTAFDDYAIQAFEADAIDYVLKPFDANDIEKAIRKIKKLFSKRFNIDLAEKLSIQPPQPNHFPLQFCFYQGDKTHIVHYQDIQFAYAENREVFVQTIDGEKYTCKLILQELEDKLDPNQFFRCHRSYIVNMFYAKEISPGFNRGYLLTMKGTKNVEIPVSRAMITKLSRYICF